MENKDLLVGFGGMESGPCSTGWCQVTYLLLNFILLTYTSGKTEEG